jgi:hypothetical protein
MLDGFFDIFFHLADSMVAEPGVNMPVYVISIKGVMRCWYKW